jgi:hypothetical protein
MDPDPHSSKDPCSTVLLRGLPVPVATTRRIAVGEEENALLPSCLSQANRSSMAMAMVMNDAYYTGGCAVKILQDRFGVELPRQYQLSEPGLCSRIVLKAQKFGRFRDCAPRVGPKLKVSF